jgi:hypothetical protein
MVLGTSLELTSARDMVGYSADVSVTKSYCVNVKSIISVVLNYRASLLGIILSRRTLKSALLLLLP